MTTPEVEIVDVPVEERAPLERILEESFEGLYLRHSRKTLAEIRTVMAAKISGEHVGLVMFMTLEQGAGYVYYVAVAKSHRGSGVATLLVRKALASFVAAGLKDAYASVEEDNIPSEKLFAEEGFRRTNLTEMSKKYGLLHALNMYRVMLVVPGEILLHRSLEQVS